MNDIEFHKIPNHLAVIMDGNGRWAKSNNLPRLMGHKKGADKVKKLIEYCINYNINCLTLFVFSSENWSRPGKEVSSLMKLLVNLLKKETIKLEEEGIKLQVIGNRERLNADLLEEIQITESITQNNNKLILNLAIDYGGKWDITQAVKKITKSAVEGDIAIDDINENLINSELSLSSMPSVDLLIRTGNVSRLSNFLLWQLSYSELYFSKVLWPDFDEREFRSALSFYQAQERLFGKIREQVVAC